MLILEKIKKKTTLYKLAKTMQVPLSTVYSWKDKIPAWRVGDVIKALDKLKINISECEEK